MILVAPSVQFGAKSFRVIYYAMDRLLPVNVLLLLEDWFGKCFTCVKWDSLLSCMFQLTHGIRQGGVLSPYLIALYVDDTLAIVAKRRSGCFYQPVCVYVCVCV